MSSVILDYAVSQNNSFHGQDAYSCEPTRGFFAISDGTSNYVDSGIISQMVVDKARTYISLTKRAIVSFGGMTKYISRCLQAETTERGCATLLTALIHCRNDRALVRIGTIGDSVGYLVSGQHIVLKTSQQYTMGQDNEKILSTFFDSRTGLYFFEHPPLVYRHHLLVNQESPSVTVILVSDGVADGFSDDVIAACANDQDQFPNAHNLASFLVDSSDSLGDKTAVVIRLLPGNTKQKLQ